MMGRVRRLAALALLVVLTGCALVAPPDQAVLPGGGRWRLPGPGALGEARQVLQRVDAEFGEHRTTLLFYLEVEPVHLALLATTPEGLELFALELRETKPRLSATRSPLTPRPLQPVQVLADLQLAYWPVAALQAALADTGVVLAERADGSGRVRELRRGSDILVTIHYDTGDPWRAGVRFEQHVWGYRYTVTTLEASQP